MNIFEMYYDNDKCADFWVIRNSWGNTVARIVSIGGIESGPIKGFGRYPYFNEAKESVYAEMYEIINTSDGYLFNQIAPIFDVCPSDPDLAIISCPNTYAYSLLDFSKYSYWVKKFEADDPTLLVNEIKPTFGSSRKNYLLTEEKIKLAKEFSGVYSSLKIEFSVAEQVFIVSFNYSEKLVTALKSITSGLRKFSSPDKVWLVDISCLDQLKEIALGLEPE